MDAFVFLKRLIFFLPLPVAIAVAWHCRRRGKRFSRLLVYAPPFLLPVIVLTLQGTLGVDLFSLLLGEKGIELMSRIFGKSPFIAPYVFSGVTCGLTMLMGKVSLPVHRRLGSLSLFELFWLHAAIFVLSLVFSILFVIWVSCSFGRGC